MPEDKLSPQDLLKTIRDKLGELEDTQLVNKLDIINMKNELDKMSLTSAPSPETTEKISELAKLAQKSDKFKKLEQSYDDIEKLKAEIEKTRPVDTEALKLEISNLKKQFSEIQSAPAGSEPSASGSSREISKMKKEISDIQSALKKKAGGEGAGAGELSARIDELEKGMAISAASKPVGDAPKQFEELAKRIERLESAPPSKGGKPADIPPDIRSDIDALKSRVDGIESAPPAARAGGAGSKMMAEVMKRLGKVESSKPQGMAPAAVPDDVRADMEALKARIDEIGKAAPAARKPAAIGPSVKAEILDRIAKLEARKAAPAGSLPANVRADLAALSQKVSRLEKAKAAPAAAAQAATAQRLSADIQAKLRKVEDLSADIRSIKAMVAASGGKAKGRGKKKVAPAMPSDLLRRIRSIEGSLQKLDILKPDMKLTKAAVLKLENQVSKLTEKKPGPSVEEVESMLENVRASLMQQGKEILDLHEEESKRVDGHVKKIDDLTKKMAAMDKRLSEATFEDKANAGELDELRADLSVLRATTPKGLPEPEKLKSILGEFGDLKTRMADIERAIGESKIESGSSERMDSISNEISVMKTKLTGMEQTVAGAGMAPQAMEELKRMKGQFPIEEFTKMQERMKDLEKALSKTSKMAESLKPIELPDAARDSGGKASPELEKKVDALGKLIGEGVTPARIRDLEARMEEIKSRLPEEIGKGTEVRLDKLKDEMQSKLKELDDIKKTIVESSLEQLLAQPANLGKLIDKKLADDVHELREKVEKMSTKSGYPDAKLAAILKESDDRIREVDKLRDRVKELEGTAVKGFEELETEIKAMTSKLGSVHGSVKGMEEAGAAGVMRDLEILKTKAEWLESTVQKFDLKPIYDKMEELETRVSASGRGGGGYAPIVIE